MEDRPPGIWKTWKRTSDHQLSILLREYEPIKTHSSGFRSLAPPLPKSAPQHSHSHPPRPTHPHPL